MNKEDFLATLAVQYKAVGKTMEVNSLSGVSTFDTQVFEVDGRSARWRTISWHLFNNETYLANDPKPSAFLTKVQAAIKAKKTSGEYWTAKITYFDEVEGFADISVSVATALAKQVENKLFRFKENPLNTKEIIVSQVVDIAKNTLFEKWWGTSDTVDTSVTVIK